METKRRSRWDNKKSDAPFRWEESDLDICKLFAPNVPAHNPWGYTYLPSSFVPVLLDRGAYAKKRLRPLCDHRFLRKPEQPRNNYRNIIYALESKGADKLKEIDFQAQVRQRRLAHELQSCMIAASFEIGARKHNHSIKIKDAITDEVRPDWHIFTVGKSAPIYIEADTDSEDLTSSNPQANTIEGKFEAYLSLIKQGVLGKSLILFFTVLPSRRDSMVALLKDVMDTHHLPYKYADHFGFMAIPFDRYLNKLPDPTPWALTHDYKRAGEPLNFRDEV